jgi:peptidyl-prolyl cis-trans isomerase SurA
VHRLLPKIACALLLSSAALLRSGDVEASIVERVVAVVGERPILLSELRQRARPHLFRIASQTQNPTQQAAAENEMFRDLLNRMIDDRLTEQAADKAHLTVTPEEVDAAIRDVAQRAHLDPRQVVAEAKKSGLSEQEYRDEMRRQVLQGKLIQLRVRGRVRVTDQDARAAYQHMLKETSEQQPVELRIIVLQVPPGATEQTANARLALGEEIVHRAKSGDDFCQLVKQYSDDAGTKDRCGSNGPVPLRILLPELQEAATTLKPGEVSKPIVFRDPSGQQAILIVQPIQTTSSKPAGFEEVKDQMMERAFLEATDRQWKLWLQELRRGVYIDMRL